MAVDAKIVTRKRVAAIARQECDVATRYGGLRNDLVIEPVKVPFRSGFAEYSNKNLSQMSTIARVLKPEVRVIIDNSDTHDLAVRQFARSFYPLTCLVSF